MFLKKQPRASAVLTTIFLLFGILVVSLIGLDVIMNGLAARRAQGASARALAAAESGLERALAAFKSDRATDTLFADCSDPADGGYLRFCADSGGGDDCDIIDSPGCDANNAHYYHLNRESVNPTYSVFARTDGRDVILRSRGSYQDTNREVYLKFCLPDCRDKAAGDDDGCGGKCQ